MTGEMCWLPKIGTDGQKILHLRLGSNQPWLPYTALPGYAIADYNIPGGSKGWATYQKLIKAGWILVNSSQAKTLTLKADIVSN